LLGVLSLTGARFSLPPKIDETQLEPLVVPDKFKYSGHHNLLIQQTPNSHNETYKEPRETNIFYFMENSRS